MDYTWLYSLCQCILSVSLIVLSVRLCMATASARGSGRFNGIVSSSLRLCLGWVGALGGALEVPALVLLSMRAPRCLYTCMTLVCCPLLARQFTTCLLLLLSLDGHLRQSLADRYSSVVTQRRALCVVLLCWMGSVVFSFSPLMGSAMLDIWSGAGTAPEGDTSGLDLGDNGTSSSSSSPPTPPPPSTPQHPRYPANYLIIGNNLPYGGFLSKFYMEDPGNFTYAEIHMGHWGVCSPDTVFSPQFLVYVHGVTNFLLPFLGLTALYLDLLCIRRRQIRFYPKELPEGDPLGGPFPLALSLSLLVLLCLPLHITHLLLLLRLDTGSHTWGYPVAKFLFRLYSLVPPLLFTPGTEGTGAHPLPRAAPGVPAAVVPAGGKAMGKALCETMQRGPWCRAKHSLRAAKLGPEV